MDPDVYLEWIRIEGDRFAAAVAAGPAAAAIAACPGWTLADLAVHLGSVHRWAADAAASGVRPSTARHEPPEGADLAAWYREGLAELDEALSGADPAGPTWHPFPVARVGAVWPRRQAHETAVHRWDAQTAVGAEPDIIDAKLAADGIDELLSLVIPGIVARESATPPEATVHLHCTDIDGEWLVWSDEGGYRFSREHAKGDAAIRGPAHDLLLFMYQRLDGPTEHMQIFGDEAVADAWRALAGS